MYTMPRCRRRAAVQATLASTAFVLTRPPGRSWRHPWRQQYWEWASAAMQQRGSRVRGARCARCARAGCVHAPATVGPNPKARPLPPASSPQPHKAQAARPTICQPRGGHEASKRERGCQRRNTPLQRQRLQQRIRPAPGKRRSEQSSLQHCPRQQRMSVPATSACCQRGGRVLDRGAAAHTHNGAPTQTAASTDNNVATICTLAICIAVFMFRLLNAKASKMSSTAAAPAARSGSCISQCRSDRRVAGRRSCTLAVACNAATVATAVPSTNAAGRMIPQARTRFRARSASNCDWWGSVRV